MSNAADRIEEIFWEAAHLAPGDEREGYLARACSQDRELRQRVDRLLQVQPKVEGFLERPFAGPAPMAVLPEACEGPGSVIGPYKLLEQIGEGGMGLVFMAEQLQPVRRKVALKVLKPGMDTRQVVARFEAERQALALMDHPHIAQVFDAGTTPTGRPYFVMELVRGVPLTEFCDQRRLTTRQRLELFISVCQAVQHAHQKGIIHRDLKPTNVLVTLHDTVAVPKVIDFGIAKAVGQQLSEQTLFTHFAQLVGTPLYMSPEQAEMNGLDVDTRSDVYSLGVMLYELLTGTTPFESETLRRAGLDELRRLIREQEPPPPSHRVNTLEAGACSTVSERRGVDGRRLRQLLQGELDWIVMKALEKDRNRRYESASALAADVQRYLNDEAVEACPPSAAYRLRKYARRNRRVLVTAGIVAVALIAATVVSTWQAVRARDAQHQAEVDRDRAKTAQTEAEAAKQHAATEAAIARAVNQFLQEDLLGQAASAPQFGQEIGGDPYLTVKEALDRAAARIGQRFRDQPLVEAAIRTTIGEAYSKLLEHQLALPQLERAIELRKAYLDPDHPHILRSMDKLPECYLRVDRHADAIALRLYLLKNREAHLGCDHPETLARVRDLASTYLWTGQLDTSGRLFEQLLEKQRTLFGPTHPDTLATMHGLAVTYGHMDRFSESMALYEKLLALGKSMFSPGHGSIWELHFYAQICQWAGKHDQVDHLLREAIKRDRQKEDSQVKRNMMANTLGYLAVNRLVQGQYEEAELFAREAVALSYVRDGKHFYWVSVLGAVLLGQQKYAEAEPLLLQGYEGMKPLEAIHPAVRKRVTEAGGWILRLYEVTEQPEKAREWREKVKSK